MTGTFSECASRGNGFGNMRKVSNDIATGTGLETCRYLKESGKGPKPLIGIATAFPLLSLFLLTFFWPNAVRAQYSERDEQPQTRTTVEDFSAEDQVKEPIAVRNYVIDADLNPKTHQIKAKARIQFQALMNVNSADFQLNSNFFPTKIAGEDGRTLSAQRSSDGMTLQISLGKTLPKGQTTVINLEYEGTLANADHSPVEGIQLAYIGEEGSYLLYPGRWFPVSGYSTRRYTAELHLTVPVGFNVVSGGKTQAPTRVGDKVLFSFSFDKPQFPGSLAVVPLQPEVVKAEGLNMKVYFSAAHQAMARGYGEAAARMVNFFSGKFGPPPVADLSIVEIDDLSLGGYAGPEVIFLASRGIGTKVNEPLLAQEVAQQWWRGLVSPATLADLWIDHGLATYSAALYLESESGAGALNEHMRQMSIGALTNDTIPIRSAGRLADFSPQFHSLVYDKAGVVLHMLRWVIGDEAFFRALKQFADKFAFQSATTDDFRKLAGQIAAQNLGPFFLQWFESTGASNFRADYVVYRVPKGYKVVGKIHQDMDTFSMPVEVEVETNGKPVTERVQVTGRDSEFTMNSADLPKKVIVDPNDRVLKFNDRIRVQVAVERGEQAVAQRDYSGALEEYQKAIDINRLSSLAHYRVGEAFFSLRNYQSAANAFREALNGDQVPKWTEVWSHLYLGKIFDLTGQRDRAVNEYQQAVRTRDNTQGAQLEAKKYIQKPYERVSREIESADASSNASPTTPSDASTTAAPADTQNSDDKPRLRRHNLQSEAR